MCIRDRVGVDESVLPPKKEKREPITFDDVDKVAQTAAKYDLNYVIYKLDRLADEAVMAEKPQFNAAITAVINIGKFLGYGEPKIVNNNISGVDLSSMTHDEKMAKAKEIIERMNLH